MIICWSTNVKREKAAIHVKQDYANFAGDVDVLLVEETAKENLHEKK